MRENITKVAERGERLDQLQDKTGAYSRSAVRGAGRGALVLVLRMQWPVHSSSASAPAAASVIRVTGLTYALVPLCADNLAVSAQGFRRGANRVRKVCTSVML